MKHWLSLDHVVKLLAITLALLYFVLFAEKHVFAGGYQFVVARATDEIAASGSNTPQKLELHGLSGLGGYFGLQVTVTGDGTVKGEYQISNDCATFVEPASASDIFTGMTKTGGPESDGNAFYAIYPEPCRCIKILFTETGTSDAVNVYGLLTAY